MVPIEDFQAAGSSETPKLTLVLAIACGIWYIVVLLVQAIGTFQL